jgi:hypothetical protein
MAYGRQRHPFLHSALLRSVHHPSVELSTRDVEFLHFRVEPTASGAPVFVAGVHRSGERPNRW